MPVNFSNQWRLYHKLIEPITKLEVQKKIFPNRQNITEEYNEKRNQLFNDYEGFTNINNEVNTYALKVTIKNWFKDNCEVKSSREVEDWIKNQNLEKVNIIRDIADDIVGKNLCKLCFCGGCAYCPQSKGNENTCARKLMSGIIKASNNYTHIPNTDKNLETFINSGSRYLEKEVTVQEESASPIEDIMYEALLPIAKKYNYKLIREYPVYDDGRLEIRYSLDMVFVNEKEDVILNIECDGLSFHSNYDSMTNDRLRDRWLLIRGIPVMRFTSREIFNDLKNSIIQIDYALNNISKWKR